MCWPFLRAIAQSPVLLLLCPHHNRVYGLLFRCYAVLSRLGLLPCPTTRRGLHSRTWPTRLWAGHPLHSSQLAATLRLCGPRSTPWPKTKRPASSCSGAWVRPTMGGRAHDMAAFQGLKLPVLCDSFVLHPSLVNVTCDNRL